MSTQIFLTPKELAERWRMHKGTLARWRIEGKGPRYNKITETGKVLYAVLDIEQWERERRRRNTA